MLIVVNTCGPVLKCDGVGSIYESLASELLRKVGLAQGVDVGDVRKSWDVIKTADFLVDRVPRGAPILDIGGYASEILCVLHKLNFSDLTGIDLDPRLDRMPCGNAIKYMSGDFTQTQFETETFSAITAISVLEHGYCGPKVFNEISRLLKVGGYLISSVDYWPEKMIRVGYAYLVLTGEFSRRMR